MPYKTDGSTHHGGVRNEHNLVDTFNANPPRAFVDAYPGQPLRFVQEGGTGQVDDVGVFSGDTRLTGISAKNHGGGSATFDYIKTSKVSEYIPTVQPLVEQIEHFKRAFWKNPEAVPALRKLVKEGVDALWSTMTSEDIRKLLKVIDTRNSAWVCINDRLFRHEQLVELSLHPHDPDVHYELRTAHAQSSRQIWRTKDGQATNTHLRIRLILNNGVTAALGLSTANKNAYLCIQVQQDDVRNLLTQVVPA
jgi:hypothetical protein